MMTPPVAAKNASFLDSYPNLTDQEFEQWQQLLEERTGISFASHRKILQTGLIQRMREVGSRSYHEYYNAICYLKGGASEWAALLKTLTVKETRFWRDIDALNFFKQEAKKKLLQIQTPESFNVWSVASSTGEEPYTLAILCHEVLSELETQAMYGVTATDICLASLSFARKGIYPKRRLDIIDEELRQRYFIGNEKGQYRVADIIRDRVCFAQANLVDLAGAPINDMDVIYCQNVLIYFKPERQRQVLDELVERLKPNGLLIVGMGEALSWQNNKVKRVKHESVQAFVKQA